MQIDNEITTNDSNIITTTTTTTINSNENNNDIDNNNDDDDDNNEAKHKNSKYKIPWSASALFEESPTARMDDLSTLSKRIRGEHMMYGYD